MNIQWFPGHMTKARRMIEEDVKLVDVVVELLDARIPYSSKNPDVMDYIRQKPHLLVLNKADIADAAVTQEWISYYHAKGIPAVEADSVHGGGVARVFDAVRRTLSDKLEREREKGFVNKKIKMMIVGVPNVGKSSFINKVAKRASAKTGDKPGVTRGKQWIRLQDGYELLDTPGILWPRFDDQSVGMKLAFTGAVKDEIMDVEELACALLGILRSRYPQRLLERYQLESLECEMDYELLERIAKKRGFLVAGGQLDTRRAAIILLDEFRGARLGKISLERPEDCDG